MSKTSSVIEVNGNQYDAVTGQLVGVVQKISSQVKTPLAGSSIDGFSRRPRAVRAAQKVHQRAAHTQTLMRSAVKKPAKLAVDNVQKSAAKVRHEAIDPMHFSRAGAIAKSSKVSRFGHPQAEDRAQANAPLKGELVDRHHAVSSPKNAATRTMPSMVTSVSQQKLERLLDLALVRADAHKQAAPSSRGLLRRIKHAPKWLSIGVVMLALLLIGGFVASQKVPQLAIKIAAFRAGINASIPTYIPRGFSFSGPVKINDKSVTLDYKTDSNGNFELTQKATNMDSTSLAATVLPKGTQVQTSQVNGTTVYIYGSHNNATWVNHGIAYSIKDSADLESDQLLRIAGSL